MDEIEERRLREEEVLVVVVVVEAVDLLVREGLPRSSFGSSGPATKENSRGDKRTQTK